ESGEPPQARQEEARLEVAREPRRAGAAARNPATAPSSTGRSVSATKRLRLFPPAQGSRRPASVRCAYPCTTDHFALTLAAVTLRICLPASMLAGLPYEAAYRAIAWLCWVPNLVAAR